MNPSFRAAGALAALALSFAVSAQDNVLNL